ncbi:MAG: hypothetical protein CVT95_03295 [Bacteroidetes bacterium HGW-Bacteroidetes-12]|nr:MAG: hypothetical protein CVT95_03295 [Bacteroidetes bacterium HGW-Bacteroidetes-12]
MIYTYYYTDRVTADVFKYFDDSKILFASIKSNPIDFFQMLFGLDFNTAYFHEQYYSKMGYWYRVNNSNFLSDTHIIIRFNMFVRLFSFGFYHVHNVFINFVALVGLVAIYKAFLPFFQSTKKILFLTICFIPSLLFWGSGLLKEGIIIFALGFFLIHFFKLSDKYSLQSVLVVLITSMLMIFTKLSVIAAIIPCLIGYVMHKKTTFSAFYSYAATIFILIAISFLMVFFTVDYNPFSILINKQQDFIYLVEKVDVGSAINQPKFNSISDVFLFMPEALINVLLRPFLWESYSVFTLFSALENSLFFILLFVVLFFRKKTMAHPSIFYFCLLYAITSALIIGLTTPIMGAIVRYKIFTTLFLLIALLMLLDVEKLKNSWFFTIFKK